MKQYKTTILDGYVLIVDDSEIKEGDWCLSKLNEILIFGKKFTASLYKKIIAYLPLLPDVPPLEDLPLLPPIKQPKLPVAFNCEMVEFEVDMGLGEECIEYGQYPKTISTPNGEQWIGEWVY